jgi:hypothetical protein
MLTGGILCRMLLLGHLHYVELLMALGFLNLGAKAVAQNEVKEQFLPSVFWKWVF